MHIRDNIFDKKQANRSQESERFQLGNINF